MIVSNELDQTSSIGAVWPPQEASYGRMRGFYTAGVVRDVDDTALFASEFAHYEHAADMDESVSRLSVRVVARMGMLATMHEMGLRVEGALPLSNLAEDDLCIAYLAAGRQSTPEDLARHEGLLTAAVERPRHNGDPTEVLREQHLTWNVVDHTQAETLVPSFADLYGAFGYNADDVRTILSNPNNTIVYALDGDQVVSTAMVELGNVTVRGLPTVRIGEVTEAFTREDYRGRHLYEALSRIAVDHVRAREGDTLNCLYGESNLNAPGVVYAAQANGRNFSRFDEAGATIPNYGILQRNVGIGDGGNTEPRDFALSYVPL